MSHVYKKPRIMFIGQNSHGSDESWDYRNKIIKQVMVSEKIAVLIECPTIDLIIYALRKVKRKKKANLSFLKTSTYWWMRSVEFYKFIEKIPYDHHVLGFDVPLSTERYSSYVDIISDIPFSERESLLSLMKYDIECNKTMFGCGHEEREVIMADKISLLLSKGYQHIFVICHNFHASKNSWLRYPSVCQSLQQRYPGEVDIYSCAIFPIEMDFIATYNGNLLRMNKINNACRELSPTSWRVKMVSSYYRSEKEDSFSMIVSTPIHFDEVITIKKGNSINIEGVS